MDDSNPIPTLEDFPTVPVEGLITVAEIHSELHAVPSNPNNPSTARGFCPIILDYNAVDGHQLTSRLPFKIPSIRTSNLPASLIIERNQGISKALWDAWWENGIKGVNSCLADIETREELSNVGKISLKILAGLTSLGVSLYETPSTFLTFLFPHLAWKVEDLNAEFSHIRGWKESWIRAIAWHPTASYLAIALNDDSIRCCVVGKDVVPMLRCQEQKNVSSVAWRPNITSELAVGCENCIVIWKIRPPGCMKGGKDKTVILTAKGHSPVTCVEYSRDGIFLLSSSAKDSSVYIWDAFTHDKTPLTRIGGGGITTTLWAPSGNRFLAASPSNVFWVWENREYWTCKRWNTPKTLVEAACWNPSGTILLFATGGFIYGIFFELSPVDQFVAQTDSIVKPVFNIEECHVFDCDGKLGYKVGGKVRQMDWDQSGYRVAVAFDDSEMVALFRVLPKSRTEILAPLGLIRGHPDECPNAIAFQKNFKDGALLTIAWNTGRIQHFPMMFALPSSGRNIMHEDHYRTQHVVQGRPSMFTAAGFVSPRLSVTGTETSLSLENVAEIIRQEEEPTSPSRLFSVS